MKTAILASIDLFESISQRLAAAVEAGTIQERSDILALRREQETAIEVLHDAVVEALAHAQAPARQELEPQVQERLQTMRRAILLHQGKWPAVLIASDPDGFLDSARRTRLQKTAALDWIRREVLPRI